MEAFLAHSSRDGCPPQTYEAHIRGVYAKASAYVAGVEQYTAKAKDILTEIVQKSALMHDLGKLDDENQNVLHSSDRGKRHLPINHVDAGRVVAKALADYGNGGGHPAMAGGFIPKKNMEKLEPDRDYKLEMLFLEQIKTEEGR